MSTPPTARMGNSSSIPGAPSTLARLMQRPSHQRQPGRVGRLRRALHVRPNPGNDLRLLDARDDLERPAGGCGAPIPRPAGITTARSPRCGANTP